MDEHIAELVYVLREILEDYGCSSMSAEELVEEERLGNGAATVVIRARKAIQDALTAEPTALDSAPKKKGRPAGDLLEGSLTSKLYHLRVGETVYLDDTFSEGKATLMERSVTAIAGRSAALAGRTFATQRFAAVQTAPAVAKQILGVTRTT